MLPDLHYLASLPGLSEGLNFFRGNKAGITTFQGCLWADMDTCSPLHGAESNLIIWPHYRDKATDINRTVRTKLSL